MRSPIASARPPRPASVVVRVAMDPFRLIMADEWAFPHVPRAIWPASPSRRTAVRGALALHLPAPLGAVLRLDPAALAWALAVRAPFRDDPFELELRGSSPMIRGSITP